VVKYSLQMQQRHLFTPHCRLPGLHIEPENWPPNSPDLKPVYYSVWERCNKWYRHKISDILAAETRASRLLGSAKPGHVKSSDRSAAKKTDDGYQGQGYPC